MNCLQSRRIEKIYQIDWILTICTYDHIYTEMINEHLEMREGEWRGQSRVTTKPILTKNLGKAGSQLSPSEKSDGVERESATYFLSQLLECCINLFCLLFVLQNHLVLLFHLLPQAPELGLCICEVDGHLPMFVQGRHGTDRGWSVGYTLVRLLLAEFYNDLR